jgi:hypothetical protein
MNNKKAKVEKFLTKQLTTTNNTSNILLLQVDDNNHILFGKYAITKENNSYILRMDNDDKERTFSTLKTAVTWCVFNERKKTVECKQIEQIDCKLSSLEVDILQKTKVLNNTKDEKFKFVYISKIEEDNMKKKILLKQLNRFINISKAWQDKKFNDSKSTGKR